MTRFLPAHSLITHSGSLEQRAVLLRYSKLQSNISSPKVFAFTLTAFQNECAIFCFCGFLKHSLSLTFLQLCFTSGRSRGLVIFSQQPPHTNLSKRFYNTLQCDSPAFIDRVVKGMTMRGKQWTSIILSYSAHIADIMSSLSMLPSRWGPRWLFPLPFLSICCRTVAVSKRSINTFSTSEAETWTAVSDWLTECFTSLG